MKIAHLSRNPIPYLNDDEGAISDALRRLGHEVDDVLEKEWYRLYGRNDEYDATLFHHWYDGLKVIPNLPGKKVLWYFDHVDFSRSCPGDGYLMGRNAKRLPWAHEVIGLVDLAFFTDGDWVNTVNRPHVHWLMQGADHRLEPDPPHRIRKKNVPLMFAGLYIGRKRTEMLKRVEFHYPEQFRFVRLTYRTELAKVIARTKIVLAPNSPVTDYYWSNRVFMSSGFGGFVLHPYCKGIRDFYAEDELVTYNGMNDLYEKIGYYLSQDEEREAIATRALARTNRGHTYLERCKILAQELEKIV